MIFFSQWLKRPLVQRILQHRVLPERVVDLWRKKIGTELEMFFISGPTLIGFSVALVKYAPRTLFFESGFHSGCFSITYVVLLIFFQILDSLFFSATPIVLPVMNSVAAFVYIMITGRNYLLLRRQKSFSFPFSARLRAGLDSFLVPHAD